MPRLNHVSIAVRDINKFARLYENLFGIKFSSPKFLQSQKVNLSCGETEGVKLELVSPPSEDSPIAKFLVKKGEGLHHICLEVENLDLALDGLKKKDVEILGAPAIGGSGKKIIFLHPKSPGGGLIQL